MPRPILFEATLNYSNQLSGSLSMSMISSTYGEARDNRKDRQSKICLDLCPMFIRNRHLN